jgi:4-hydroxybenzoyl-CoA thioesterase
MKKNLQPNKFNVKKTVRMQHCDTGGVVFTPQYFNLFTEVLEDWFARELDYSFSQMVATEHSGIPAMKIVARFVNPSRLGDILDYSLYVKRLRATNVLVSMAANVNEELRCEADFLFGFAVLPNLKLAELPSSVFLKMKNFQ